jgi:hypothetical protein
MKKSVYFLLAALMTFGTLSCKKDHEYYPGHFEEKDLVGAWACTEVIQPDGSHEKNPPFAYLFNADHTGKACYWDTPYAITWKIEKGAKLVMRQGDGTGWSDMIIGSLDGRHMHYTQDGSFNYYTNIEKLLPGTWEVSGGVVWYLVTFDESGTSVWKYAGNADLGTHNWSLDVDGSRIVIKVTGPAINDDFKILKVADDQLSTTNKFGTSVAFAQAGGE